ncbi:MAG TPA: M13 family metallopeptidase [Steroidobacteraceae bacterium]|jgi:predicted metalloendopeptidase
MQRSSAAARRAGLPWLPSVLRVSLAASLGLLPPCALSEPISGIELQYADDGVRPQDDFYRHVNGKWLDSTQIPLDQSGYDSWNKLEDDAHEQLRGIIEQLQRAPNRGDPDQQKIADLYASFMDEATLEQLGLKPLANELATIEALTSRQQIAALMAHFNRIEVTVPYVPSVHQDAKDASRYVYDLRQDGLGMPDRDYYLQGKRELRQTRTLYRQHVEDMLRLAGDPAAAREAADIVALETKLARAQWTQVQSRDPVKTYNRYTIAQLTALMPGYDWSAYLGAAGVLGKVDYLVIGQPSYFRQFNQILATTPLPVWQSYFRWHLLSDYARFLDQRTVTEQFSFYGTSLLGVPQIRPRWRRGVELVDDALGEALGRLYCARYFPPESKARMDQLVEHLIAAFRADIATLDWMGPQTRQRALAKLAKLTPKIGYPEHWRDYSRLQIRADDLVGNVMRAREFDYQRNLDKLGKPVDRSEWFMTPQTVNAYHNPELNEIVFPAAVLQPPFFDARADDAANYGSIGAVIGHEISHAFDDNGSQYDGDGNLLGTPGWFTSEDYRRFRARTQLLVRQYAAQQPLPGYHINGQLTLGENIADNSGLAVAYKAYRLSLQGREAPVIDGLSGDQRFYMGFAQTWRDKTRDNQIIVDIKTDKHSPNRYRGSLPLMNQAPFYAAFEVKPGDGMYLPPPQRVSLW